MHGSKPKVSVPRKSAGYFVVWRWEKKLRVLNHYGNGNPKCECCGLVWPEFLTLDHLDPENAPMDRKLAYGQLIWWLEKEKYPPGFQILCFVCNSSKGKKTKHGKRGRCVFHDHIKPTWEEDKKAN